MRNGLLVAFSPLLLEGDLHLALGVLHDGRLDLDLFWWDRGTAAHCELARADLVNVRERQDVADLYVLEAGHCEEVAGGEQVFSAGDRGDDILRGLRADEGERVRCRGWCMRCLRVQRTGSEGAQGRCCCSRRGQRRAARQRRSTHLLEGTPSPANAAAGTGTAVG